MIGVGVDKIDRGSCRSALYIDELIGVLIRLVYYDWR